MNLTVQYSTQHFYKLCFRHAVKEALEGEKVLATVDDYGDYVGCEICDAEREKELEEQDR